MKQIIIYTLLVISLGWIGLGADLLMNNDVTQGIGILLFILAPCLLAIIFSIKDKQIKRIGLKPEIKQNLKWYAFCFLFDFMVFLLIFLIGALGNGMVTVPTMSLIQVILVTALVSIPTTLIKNVFEEIGWRGYLSERLYTMMNPRMANVVVGLIWATWQLPYWLIIIPRDLLISFSPYGNFGLIIVMCYVSLINLSFLYNRIKFMTKSVWPVIIIHTMNNVLVASLFMNITYVAQVKWFFSPGINGIMYLSGLFLINLYLEVKKPITSAVSYHDER